MKENVKIIIRDVLIACVIALTLTFFVGPTLVQETSMQPSVNPYDYLLMLKHAYGKINRGNIIVFKSSIRDTTGEKELLIKRVVGIPGDIITISDNKVYRNGKQLKEKYTYSNKTSGEIYNLIVPKGEVFVMGDHREVSIDSRAFGCVKESKIVGKVFFRIYPFKKMGAI